MDLAQQAQQVVDTQAVNVQLILAVAIPWIIRKAIESNLPLLNKIQFSWARWLSVASSGLVALGIHISWMGGWDVMNGGTVNLALMAPGLPDIVTGLSQFILNEIFYRALHKPTTAVIVKTSAPLTVLDGK